MLLEEKPKTGPSGPDKTRVLTFPSTVGVH